MQKLRVQGEVEVPIDVLNAILDKYGADDNVYTVNFYVKLNKHITYNVDVPIAIKRIIE